MKKIQIGMDAINKGGLKSAKDFIKKSDIAKSSHFFQKVNVFCK